MTVNSAYIDQFFRGEMLGGNVRGELSGYHWVQTGSVLNQQLQSIFVLCAIFESNDINSPEVKGEMNSTEVHQTLSW